MEHNKQAVAAIIAANKINEIELAHFETVDQTGTNVRKGDFFAYINGATHPCYIDGSNALGYRVDDSVVYDPRYKGWRDYTPGKPDSIGKVLYEAFDKL